MTSHPTSDSSVVRNGWRMVHENRYVRVDGAVVMRDQRSPYPNPLNPKSLLWTAWEPDPSESAISKQHYHSAFRSPRRWKSPEAAMKAVDRLFPLGKPHTTNSDGEQGDGAKTTPESE